MIDIEIFPIPNQSFSITLDDSFYDVTIKETKGIMSVDIFKDNLVVERGVRAAPGFPLIPYEYLQGNFGNFIFITQNDEYPYYDKFGITQSLIYASPDELEVIRAGA